MKEQTKNDPKFMQTGAASRRLGVHPHTLRKWAKLGAIDYFVSPSGQFWYDVEGFVVRVLKERKAGQHKAVSQ